MSNMPRGRDFTRRGPHPAERLALARLAALAVKPDHKGVHSDGDRSWYFVGPKGRHSSLVMCKSGVCWLTSDREKGACHVGNVRSTPTAVAAAVRRVLRYVRADGGER